MHHVEDDKKYAVSILVEYIRSLTDNKITVEHFHYELLINCLVINKMYFQLHQMVQYHIVTDSKPLVIFKCIFRSNTVEYNNNLCDHLWPKKKKVEI